MKIAGLISAPVRNWWAPMRLVLIRHVTEYSPVLKNCAGFEKYLKGNKHNGPYLAFEICSDICPWTVTCSSKLTVFTWASLWQNCSFLETGSVHG